MTAAQDALKLAEYEAAIDREVGLRGSLMDFIRMSWPLTNPGDPFKDNWHLSAVAEHLEACSSGQIRKLVVNIPPGCCKSRMTGLFWPVWDWLRKPSLCIGTWSFDASLVLREAGHSLDLIRSPWFQQRWADKLIIKDRAPAMGEYWNTAGGLRFASTTPKGDATGWHFHRQIVDDAHKPQTVSKVTLEETEKWILNTMPSRWKDISTGVRVVVMQRLHERDLAGILQEMDYVMLRLPMRYEAKVYSMPSAPSPVKWKDPRTVEGELLWPDRFPEAEVRLLERSLGPAGTAAQMQQRPSPEGGAVFKAEWFRTWVHAGDSKDLNERFGAGAWKVLPDSFDQTICSWDCSFKDSDTSDYVCGQTWGRKGQDFFLLHEEWARMDFSATCEAVKNLSARYPGARPIIVEDKANGIAVVNTLKETIHGLEEVDPQGGKISRANATTGSFAAGNIYHPDPLVYSWVTDHRKELTSFPFGANDDRVDAMSQAIIFLTQTFQAFSSAMKKVGRVWVPDPNSPPTKEEQADVEGMMGLLYGTRVL